MVRDLKHRIKSRRKVTPPLEGVAFEYGFNTNLLDYWTDYWVNKYNFTKQEASLNQYPLFKTKIQGLDVHFAWIKPKVNCNCKTVPLLMLHGFPGSIREYYETIPLLSSGCVNGIALELVVPSLPGYGFSDGATRPGFGPTEMSTVLKNLMKRLGHDKFYVQAGDMGAFVANMMITLYTKEVLGYHTNFAVSYSPLSLATWFSAAYDTSLVVEPALESRMFPLSEKIKSYVTSTGYLHLQATKPDTIGVPMSDSPVGLLVYILNLFSYGARKDSSAKFNGDLDLFSRPDDVLDNIMMYWVPDSFTTSVRLYSEIFNTRTVKKGIYAKSTAVPVWTTHTKSEIIYQSPIVLSFKYTNILNSTVYDDYGHFFAMEAPDVFAESVWTAIHAFEDYHYKKGCKDEL
ncbi:juvenile hormone epoxide hydrolase-like [Anticarsia gemmatalis]|uniref:juvenile hormone epoxide hydrolase-like n=1 Tax=Anticarsia gemmatalis TaxID=129554 RepID=UPI003F762C3B